MEFSAENIKALTFKKHCTGEGSSRRVVPIDNDIVIKIAKNTKGIEQNRAEYSISKDMYAHRMNDCFWISDDGKYLAAARCEPIKDFEFDAMRQQIADDDDMTFDDFVLECQDGFDLIPGDIWSDSSWGKTSSGKYVLIDFGCTYDIFYRLYKR